MAERRRNSEVIVAWVAAHQAEVDALLYGRLVVIFANGARPRIEVTRAEQLDPAPAVVPGMD